MLRRGGVRVEADDGDLARARRARVGDPHAAGLPAAAALPALWLNGRRTAAMGLNAGVIWAAADLYSVVSLVRGSVRARTPVL